MAENPTDTTEKTIKKTIVKSTYAYNKEFLNTKQKIYYYMKKNGLKDDNLEVSHDMVCILKAYNELNELANNHKKKAVIEFIYLILKNEYLESACNLDDDSREIDDIVKELEQKYPRPNDLVF